MRPGITQAVCRKVARAPARRHYPDPVTEANSTDGTDIQTLSVTVTGDDRPGVTGTLLGALSGSTRRSSTSSRSSSTATSTLTVLLRPGVHVEQLRDAAAVAAHRLGLTLTVIEGTGVNARSRQGRAAVVVLGAPLSADAVSLVTTRIADHGANIDRIRRLSRYPVTTVEFDISGADVPSLRTELALVATSEGIDIAVAPGGLARRGRRLVVLDVDSTLIQQEVIELLAAHCGREAEVARGDGPRDGRRARLRGVAARPGGDTGRPARRPSSTRCGRPWS